MNSRQKQGKGKKGDGAGNTNTGNAPNNANSNNNNSGSLLPGRYQCHCHGMEHNVINNCTNCGRIVCEQEGEGPCQTCAKPITRKGQGRGMNAPESAYEQEFPDFDYDRAKAEVHKDKMLQFDRTNFMQKQVFDDQADWYQISEDVWQGEDARAHAISKIIERNDEIDELNRGFRVQYAGGQFQHVKEEYDEIKFKETAKQFLVKLADADAREKEQQNQQTALASRLREGERKLYEDIRSELQQKMFGSGIGGGGDKGLKCGAGAKNASGGAGGSAGAASSAQQAPSLPQMRAVSKIVQMDDFYSAFY